MKKITFFDNNMNAKLRVKHKKLLLAVLVVFIATVVAVVVFLNSRDADAPLLIAAESYSLVELNTGEVLHEKEPELPARIGSLTKLMIVYICFGEIEKGNASLDDIITVSSSAVNTPGPTNNLIEGMEISLDDLLYCVLVSSGNDAVSAITEHLFNDESVMVEQMNRTAGELEMINTVYTDSSGIDPFNNKSSAQDLTILVNTLLDNFPQVVNYTRHKEITVTGRHNNDNIDLTLRNTNALLGTMDGVYGLKTGTAHESNNVIVLLEHNDKNYMAIILGAPNNTTRWNSAKTLLEYGISR